MQTDTKSKYTSLASNLFTLRWFIPALVVGLSLLAVAILNQKTVRSIAGVIYRSTFPKDRAFATTAGEKWGIDLSHHQKTIDWDLLVKHNKPDFIFLKSTEGSSHIDTKYKSYKEKAHSFEIPVGAYHFFSYSSSGYDQARHFIKHSKLEKGDLLPVLDVEFRKSMNSQKWITTEIRAFCLEIKREYGAYPIIYCECAFKEQYLKKGFQEINYWISDLYREPRCEYLIWQYTDRGLVKGIGRVDNNLLRKGAEISDYQL